MYNIHNNFRNHYHEQYKLLLENCQGKWFVVMDDIYAAQELKAAGANVIYRDYTLSYNNIHKDITPEDYWRAVKHYSDVGFWVYVDNEPDITSQMVEWHTAVAKYAVRDNGRVCVLNLSVGRPEKHEWSSMAELLGVASKNPQNVIIGLHEYAPILMHYEIDKHNLEATGLRPIGTLERFWLIGRYRFLYDYTDKAGLKRPKIVITEWGYDIIHAVASTNPYPMVQSSGIKHTLKFVSQQAVLRSMQYVWHNIYAKDEGILGFCLYCVGGQGDWSHYDFADFPKLFENITLSKWPINKGATNMTIVKGVVATSVDFNLKGVVNIRSNPTTSALVVGKLENGMSGTLWLDSKATANGFEWKRIKIGDIEGWVAINISSNPVLWDTDTLLTADELLGVKEKLEEVERATKAALNEVDTLLSKL